MLAHSYGPRDRRTTIRLSAHDKKRLAEAAASEGTSLATFVWRAAIKRTHVVPKELEEENRQLKKMLMPSGLNFPPEWMLTGGERRVVTAFYSREDGFLSCDALSTMAVRPTEGGSSSYPSVIICNLHRKLKPLGIEFTNRHGYGYQITRASRELIRKAITKNNAEVSDA